MLVIGLDSRWVAIGMVTTRKTTNQHNGENDMNTQQINQQTRNDELEAMRQIVQDMMTAQGIVTLTDDEYATVLAVQTAERQAVRASTLVMLGRGGSAHRQ